MSVEDTHGNYFIITGARGIRRRRLEKTTMGQRLRESISRFHGGRDARHGRRDEKWRSESMASRGKTKRVPHINKFSNVLYLVRSTHYNKAAVHLERLPFGHYRR